MSTSHQELLLIGRQVLDGKPLVDRVLDRSWRSRVWLPGEPQDDLVRAARRADVLICGYDAVDAGALQNVLPHASALKLVQIPFRGFDWLDFERLPPGCVVCNSNGHEISIAEYVLAGLLEWEKRLADIDQGFREGSWAAGGFGQGSRMQGELYEKTIGIIGYGLIGREVAKRARAFGMRVCAVGRRRDAPPGLDRYGTGEALPELLRESDYVVVACALNEETKGLLDFRLLAHCRSHAVIVNVARGPIIREAALYEALRSHRIGGAVLDVWYQYPDAAGVTGARSQPRPSRFPFHELDNVIMSPHCSARTVRTRERVWASVAENLLRFARGADLENVVFDDAARR